MSLSRGSSSKDKDGGKRGIQNVIRSHPKELRLAAIITGISILIMAAGFLMPVIPERLTDHASLGGASVKIPENMKKSTEKDDFGVCMIHLQDDKVDIYLMRAVVEDDTPLFDSISLIMWENGFTDIDIEKTKSGAATVTAKHDSNGTELTYQSKASVNGNQLSVISVSARVNGTSAQATAEAVLDSYEVNTDTIFITVESDGEEVEVIEAEAPSEGAIVLLPTDIKKDGYAIDGWKIPHISEDEEIVEADDSNYYLVGAKKDTTVEAEWAKAWTVTFTDGDGNVISTDMVVDGEAATAPSVEDRDNALFAGWDTDFSRVTSDMTVNAKWTPIWTVTFTDGAGSTLSTQKVINSDSATAPANPTRDGYNFLGWDADFSNVTSDMTVNARWDPKPTISQENALESAESYLRVMPFSYSGLVEQLEYEGYSHEDAVYAVDRCGADWNEQAALMAQSYLDTMSFSRSGLIEQLEYEGFSYEQAVYGVDSVGL